MNRPPWTAAQRRAAIAAYTAGASVRTIADDMGRTESAVYRLLSRSGIVRPKWKWTDAEDARIRRRKADGVPVALIAAEIGRTYQAVVQRLAALRRRDRVQTP